MLGKGEVESIFVSSDALGHSHPRSKCGEQQLKRLALSVIAVTLVTTSLVFWSLRPRPCQAARAVFESYSDVSGYGTVQGMLNGDFRHLGGQEFTYIMNDANPSRRTEEPRAKSIRVTFNIFKGPDFQTMSIPVSEFYSSKAIPLTCDGDLKSPFIGPTRNFSAFTPTHN